MRHPLLQKYDRLIDFFGQVLGQDYELSLFDLRAEGCPLIFTAGGLNSGRPLGTPLTAAGLSMLERFRQGDREPLVNSHSVTADGHLLRSSAVILVDGANEPEGLLSVRFDDNRYRDLVIRTISGRRSRDSSLPVSTGRRTAGRHPRRRTAS